MRPRPAGLAMATTVAVVASVLAVGVSAPSNAAERADDAGLGRIAFADGGDIITVLPDGRDRQVVVRKSGYSVHAAPELSPDGRRLVFARSVQAMCSSSQLMVAGADGSDVRQLVQGLGYDPSWSPDGTRIAYAVDPGDLGRCAGPSGLSVVRADGTDGRIITRVERGEPAWSPSGRQLVADGGDGLHVLAPDGSGSRRITGAGNYGASWSPDGQHLANVSHDEGLGQSVLVISNVDGSQRRVVPGRAGVTGVSWAPDGFHLVVSEVGEDGRSAVRVIDRDGNATAELGSGSDPAWQRLAPDACGAGYWLAAGDGGVFTFGDAGFHGSAGGMRLHAPVVGMAATPTGRGYWLVASDGGIFTFGDAGFHGSTGGLRLNAPIVGMADAPNGLGYWLVASDGGIFTFGPARFLGSARHLLVPGQRAVAVSAADGGYRVATRDGQVIAFGDARFFGSTFGATLARPAVGLAG